MQKTPVSLQGKSLIRWLLTAIWAAQIFWFSTAPFSGASSRTLLIWLLQTIGLNLPLGVLDFIHSCSRKLAHLGEYGVLGLLIYCSLSGHRLHREVSVARAAVLFSAIYAATDEFHQVFVAGRHASVIDWGLDTAAATLAIVILYLGSPAWSNARSTNVSSSLQSH